MKLFIYGASGAGLEVYDLAERTGKYEAIYLIDDFQEEADYYGTKRIHFSSCEEYMEGASEFIISVGEPSARALLRERVQAQGYRLATLIDPSVVLSKTAVVESGCIINAHSVISSRAHLHENCYIGFHVVVGHDACIDEDTIVCPMATVGSGSHVGREAFLGLNSSMKERVNIGDRAIVGMGSMAFRDVASDCTVVGNPARVTKGNQEHKVFRDRK